MVNKLQENKWRALRGALDNNYDINNSNWGEVIQLFKKRIEDYYLTPLDTLISMEKLDGEGFSILTVQCSLIEMFAAFKKGHIYVLRGKKKKSYHYESSKQIFTEFLISESIFESIFFNSNGTPAKFSAVKFYEDVRCGLVHESRTKNEWKVNAKISYANKDVPFITGTPGHNISVDRTLLNYQLRKCFNKYIAELEEKSNHLQRRLLGRKLDHLFDINPDSSDWWIDK